MTWMACLIVVLGIGVAFGCCCDGVCLDCNANDIENLTIAFTISGVTGTESAFVCDGGITPTCGSLWNGTFLATYESGVYTSGCLFTFDDGSVISCYRRVVDATVSAGAGTVGTGFITANAGRFGSPFAAYGITALNALTCDFDETLSYTSSGGGTTDCDFTASSLNAATV